MYEPSPSLIKQGDIALTNVNVTVSSSITLSASSKNLGLNPILISLPSFSTSTSSLPSPRVDLTLKRMLLSVMLRITGLLS